MRSALALVVLVSLFATATASPSWNWNNYTGLSSWQVTVTEDETGCGGDITASQITIPVEHNGNSATFTDLHGTIGGTFVSGNVLHVPGRTVPDGDGSSKLSAYDVYFTADCSSFAARYTWKYHDAYQSCSGSTELAGTNNDGCPQVVPLTKDPELSLDEQISAAQKDLEDGMRLRDEARFMNLESLLLGKTDTSALKDKQGQIAQLDASAEAKYKAILKSDPNNYQANIAMAELKKSQGWTHEYYEYMDRALNSGQFTDAMKAAAEKNLAREMGFSTFPKPANSLLMRKMSNEKGGWQGGLYDMDVQKESQKDWNWKIFFSDGPWKDIINAATYK